MKQMQMADEADDSLPEEQTVSPEESDVEAVAPAPAAVVAKPKKTGGPRKRPELQQPQTTQRWFKLHAKYPKTFYYTKNGDLRVPALAGKPEKVMELPFYRPAPIPDLLLIEERRKTEFAAKQEEFNTARLQLRDAMEGFRASGVRGPVMMLQKRMSVLDAEMKRILTPLTWITELYSVPVRKIDFDAKGDKKLEFSLSQMKLRHTTWEESVQKSTRPFVTLDTAASEEDESDTEETTEEETFTVFFDPADQEHGFLSPDLPMEFVFNETKYFAPIQAFERERVKALGRDLDFGAAIKKQTTGKGVRFWGSKIVGFKGNPRDLWIQILQSFVAQNPVLKQQLLDTGTDILVYANPTDKVGGIGLAAGDEGVTERSKWQGTNYLGEAWMAVRQQQQSAEGAEGAGGAEGAEGGQDTQAGGSLGYDVVKEDAAEARRNQEKRKGYITGYYQRMKKLQGSYP